MKTPQYCVRSYERAPQNPSQYAGGSTGVPFAPGLREWGGSERVEVSGVFAKLLDIQPFACTRVTAVVSLTIVPAGV